jgi:hypothetical protein
MTAVGLSDHCRTHPELLSRERNFSEPERRKNSSEDAHAERRGRETDISMDRLTAFI